MAENARKYAPCIQMTLASGAGELRQNMNWLSWPFEPFDKNKLKSFLSTHSHFQGLNLFHQIRFNTLMMKLEWVRWCPGLGTIRVGVEGNRTKLQWLFSFHQPIPFIYCQWATHDYPEELQQMTKLPHRMMRFLVGMGIFTRNYSTFHLLFK